MSRMPRYKAVYAVAVRVARSIGVPLPSFISVATLFRQQYPIPQLYSNHDAAVWVDAQYVAYTRNLEDSIHYVYIRQQHIDEERRSYAEASAAHAQRISLPKDIQDQFVAAEQQMFEQQKSFAVFDIVDKSPH